MKGSTYYEIQVRFGKKDWTAVHRENRHTDALSYVKENCKDENQYPMRVVRVNRTIVFNGER